MSSRTVAVAAAVLFPAAVTAAIAAARAGTTAAPVPAPAARGAYDPFALTRALEAPNAPENAGLVRRTEIIKYLDANRVTPASPPDVRSPFRPGKPAGIPPPWTPPGGGTAPNPAGNTPGSGNGGKNK